MKILVTGGAGFIGQHIVKRCLLDGHNVVLFDHNPFQKNLPQDILQNAEVIQGDVLDESCISKAIKGCEIAFHFAALVGVDAYTKNPVRTMEVEERGLQNICHYALKENCEKIIYPSSSAVYGHIDSGITLTEDLQINPVSNYGVAKRFNELYLHSQYKENGLQSVAMRIFNVYGPGQDERLVIPRFINKAIKGEDLVIFGDGRQTRDFPFISDVVECTMRCAMRIPGHQIVNVSSQHEHSVLELAKMIIDITQSTSHLKLKLPPEDRNNFEMERCVGSNSKIFKLTGFKPQITLEDGLRQTAESFLREMENQN